MAKKHRRQLRAAFRKNREKRSRSQNLTRQALDDASSDEPLSERMSGKGDLTRYRTVVGHRGDGDAILRDVDQTGCETGRVLRAIGANRCDVEAEDGASWACTVRGVLRTLLRETRSAVVAGDRVLFRPLENQEGVIERVEPRDSVLVRGSGRFAHVIVANVEQLVIVASAADPPLKPPLIDRFLASAAQGGMRPILCINKADLADVVGLQPIVGLYARLGCDVVLTSATGGQGIDRLRSLLVGRETVFAGQSGVGKSSLLNALQPGLAQPIAEVAADSRKGRHTTRVVELIPLQASGWVIDTPGVRQMELWGIAPQEVEAYFTEFRPFVALCRFPDCTHTHETGCRVKAAVEAGLISKMRYESYLRMLDDT